MICYSIISNKPKGGKYHYCLLNFLYYDKNTFFKLINISKFLENNYYCIPRIFLALIKSSLFAVRTPSKGYL